MSINRRLSIFWAALAFNVMASALLAQQTVSDAFYYGHFSQAIELSNAKLKAPSNDGALNNLQAASAYLALGEYQDARECLIRAGSIMEDFRTHGELLGRIGSEQNKAYRGEPYEKVMAFTYTGILDYAFGDLENAYASFKTAALADTGSYQGHYHGDSILTRILQGLVARDLSEQQQSLLAFSEAITIATCRHEIECVDEALLRARGSIQESERSEKTDKKRALEIEAASRLLYLAVADASASNRDASSILQAATDLADSEFQGAPNQHTVGQPSLKDAIHRISELAQSELPDVKKEYPSQSTIHTTSFISALRDSEPNLFVIVEIGRGPYKYRRGTYGEGFGVARQQSNVADCRVSVGDRDLDGAIMEDVFSQASTKGGRKIDEINATKASFKDVLGFAAMLDPTKLTLLGFMAASPGSDTRCWDTLPNLIYIAAGSVSNDTTAVSVRFLDDRGRELPTKTAQTTVEGIRQKQKTFLLVRDYPKRDPSHWLIQSTK